MDLQFHPLLQIRLRHGYFSDSNHAGVEIVPSPVTAQLMQMMALRMVRRDYGVELFYGEGGGHPAALSEISGALRLSFWLRPTTPSFHNYTAYLPTGGAPALFYATNHGQGVAEDLNFIMEPSAIVPLEFNSFQRDISSAPEDVLIADENGGVPEDNAVTLQARNDEGTQVSAYLGGLQAGRYFFFDGDIVTAFITAGEGYQNGDVGLLSFYLGDNGEGDRAVITADGTIVPVTVTVSFTARSAIWRYNLISHNNEFRDFSISGVGDGPEFLAPAQAIRILPNQTEAHVLISTSPIQLRANPPQRFFLSYTDKGGRTHNDALLLPNAGAESLSRDQNDSTTLYSDMYVYL